MGCGPRRHIASAAADPRGSATSQSRACRSSDWRSEPSLYTTAHQIVDEVGWERGAAGFALPRAGGRVCSAHYLERRTEDDGERGRLSGPLNREGARIPFGDGLGNLGWRDVP